MDVSNTSSLINLFIIVSLLMLLITLYYVKSRRMYRRVQRPLSATANINTYENGTNFSPFGNRKYHKHQPTSTFKEKTDPFTTKEPFEETLNITIDDFYNFKGAKLLLVEDNKINQKILQSILQKSGILITVANNGLAALEYLYSHEQEFDIVLMDISMPLMDGYTCTEKIRSDHRFDMLPIITFTAFAMGKEIERMNKLGANGHITKPLHIGQLYTVFKTYLGHIHRPVSTYSALKMKGLDVEIGIAIFEGDEHLYKQKLREFIAIYGSLVKQMPQWIKEKNYDRVKHNCVKISPKLHSLGAYELEDAVTRMKKFFIYGTEHRIEEFETVFPEKLNRLIIAMRLYLQDEII